MDVGQHLHRPVARTYSAPSNYGCSYKFQSSGSISYTVSKDCDSSFDLNKSKEGNDIKHNSLKGTLVRRVDVVQHLHRPIARTYSAPSNYGCSYKLQSSGSISYTVSKDCDSSFDLNKSKEGNNIKHNSLKGTLVRRVGKRKPPKDQTVWKVTPLLCFQTDFDKESAIELLRGQGESKNIRIKPGTICDETDEITDHLIFVDKDKIDNIRAITFCLEKPIHQMLQNWSTYLETKGLGKHTSRVIAEIKAIGKQLVLEESKRTAAVFDTPCMKCKSIVPGDIKDYLFG